MNISNLTCGLHPPTIHGNCWSRGNIFQRFQMKDHEAKWHIFQRCSIPNSKWKIPKINEKHVTKRNNENQDQRRIMISDLTQLNIIYQPKQKTSPQLGVAKNTNNPLPQATTIHVKHHRLLVGQTYETPTHTHIVKWCCLPWCFFLWYPQQVFPSNRCRIDPPVWVPCNNPTSYFLQQPLSFKTHLDRHGICFLDGREPILSKTWKKTTQRGTLQ